MWDWAKGIGHRAGRLLLLHNVALICNKKIFIFKSCNKPLSYFRIWKGMTITRINPNLAII